MPVLCFSLLATGCSSEKQTQQGTPDSATVQRSSIEKPSLSKAVALGNLAEVERLVRLGANVNENTGTPTDKITPLIIAAIKGREDIAQFLLAKGADPDDAYHGYTASDFFYSSQLNHHMFEGVSK